MPRPNDFAMPGSNRIAYEPETTDEPRVAGIADIARTCEGRTDGLIERMNKLLVAVRGQTAEIGNDSPKNSVAVGLRDDMGRLNEKINWLGELIAELERVL